MPNILFVIPARGGSKGILKKNIRDVGGKPLLFWQINNALKSQYKGTILVSTDSTEIGAVVKQLFGDKVIVLWRPARISGDDTKTEAVLLHALAYYPSDIVVTLEPTNPLNRPEYVDQCIEHVLKGMSSAACFTEDYGFFLHEIEDLLDRPMRQNRKPMLRETGNCWATSTKAFKLLNNRLCPKIGIVRIPKEHALHLDDEADWHMIEAVMERDDYYRTRPFVPMKHAYWGIRADPDGEVRDNTRQPDRYIGRHWKLLNYLAQYSGKLLDFGCGVGYLMACLHDQWDKYGIEVDPVAAQKAKMFGQVHGNLAKFPDNFFDVVVASHVIEHLADPEEQLKRLWQVMRPNGKLIIETPDFECATAQVWGDKFRLLHDTTHVSLFGLVGLVRLLEYNLFEIERVEYPFFETFDFTENNLMRLFDKERVSPPAIGNVVTIYARKK